MACPAGGPHTWVRHTMERDTGMPAGTWCDECGALPRGEVLRHPSPGANLGSWERHLGQPAAFRYGYDDDGGW